MTKTGVLIREPVYPKSQFSPKIPAAWKRLIAQAQNLNINANPENDQNDQQTAKQCKITKFYTNLRQDKSPQ